MTTSTVWRRCSNCKNPIALGAKYWVCSVSSCSKVRAPVQFCKPDCWAVHEEIAFHKNAWAVEETAPRTLDEPAAPAAPPSSRSAPPTMVPRAATTLPVAAASSSPPAPSSGPSSSSAPSSSSGDVMVVVSRLKDLIKAESNGMSTSDQVVQVFSDHVRRLADKGIASARQHGRKTVLDRDIPTAGAIAKLDVLVVVSKLKDYVRAQSDLRTSDDVAAAITHELRRVVLWSIENARKDGRKTVMGRDVPAPT